MSMSRLSTASVYFFVAAQLHLGSALTTPTTAAHCLRKHVNSAIVAPARYPSATNPASPSRTPRTLWASGGFTASGSWGLGLATELDERRSVEPRATKGQRLMAMKAASPARADTGAGPAVESNSSAARSVNWPLWYVLPIAPYQKRKTLMKEIVPGKVRHATRVRQEVVVRGEICGSFQTEGFLPELLYEFVAQQQMYLPCLITSTTQYRMYAAETMLLNPSHHTRRIVSAECVMGKKY